MNFKQKIQILYKKHQYFFIMFFIFVMIAIYNTITQLKPVPAFESQAAVSPDTIIPKGYVLVPLELENIESIASIIDGFGVVDIFKVTTQKKADDVIKSTVKVLNKVKILRAPMNPDTFALLLPDEVAKKFLTVNGPFRAIIQNQSESANASEQLDSDYFKSQTKTNKSSIRIEYKGA